ncbi:hypothetical protein TSUD_426530, partial [Trifolium subterraneum]
MKKKSKEAKKVYVQAKTSTTDQINPKIVETRVVNIVNVETDDDIGEERPIVELEQPRVQALNTPPTILPHSADKSQEQVVSSNQFAALGDLFDVED